uniref:BTB domain-containing protein n=1 Tax=Cyanistes caeruleus TaxID=156563 RepID=A0A8C0UL07_CYACU
GGNRRRGKGGPGPGGTLGIQPGNSKVAAPNLLRALHSLYQLGHLCDVTVLTQHLGIQEEFLAHKAVLAASSNYFRGSALLGCSLTGGAAPWWWCLRGCVLSQERVNHPLEFPLFGARVMTILCPDGSESGMILDVILFGLE